MKQSVGQSVSINIIVIFIVIMFTFILGIVGYTKAFKVNSNIEKSLEICEGYNDNCSKKEIKRILTTLGYIQQSVKCPKSKEEILMNDGSEGICIYEFDSDLKHYSYSIITYIRLDIPIVGSTISLPVKSKTNGIYKFEKN